MQSRCTNHVSNMLYVLSRRLRRLCSTLRWFMWRPRRRPRVIIRRLGRRKKLAPSRSFDFDQNQNRGARPIRLATFNAALFSLAPAVPAPERSAVLVQEDGDSLKSPKGILKQSPRHSQNNTDDNKFAKLRPNKVSINLPENEISLAQDRSTEGSFRFNNTVAVAASAMRSPVWWDGAAALCGSRTIFDVLKEVDADILCLQDVKADEADNMRPLSDLASALGMSYVFAESWAPEFGNALLSRWPISKWRAERICDDRDFRNVIKATVEVPWMGEVNVYGTQLDHLDETWRMKQINAIMHSSTTPHFLAGGINSLDSSDYSSQRWNHIVKYYEELGKPTPKVEVTNLLKERGYTDSKHFAGECEPVVVIAKGQNVQGTCKYGTRVDYILGSEGLRYAFVPGSYSVVSSKGTSDHHIVKVDIVKIEDGGGKSMSWSKLRKRFVRMSSSSCSSKKWVESEMS